MAAPRKGSNVISRRTLVLVKRDMTAATPRVIWQHEKPILEAIFGEDTVEDVDPKKLDEGYTAKISPELLIHNKKQDLVRRPSESVGLGYAFAGDPRAEYDRLAACYGKHVERDILNVEHVYGRFQDGRFEAVVSTAQHEDMPDAQLRDIAIAYGHLPQLSKDSTAAERKEEAEARAALNKMPREELLKLVDTLVSAYA